MRPITNAGPSQVQAARALRARIAVQTHGGGCVMARRRAACRTGQLQSGDSGRRRLPARWVPGEHRSPPPGGFVTISHRDRATPDIARCPFPCRRDARAAQKAQERLHPHERERSHQNRQSLSTSSTENEKRQLGRWNEHVTHVGTTPLDAHPRLRLRRLLEVPMTSRTHPHGNDAGLDERNVDGRQPDVSRPRDGLKSPPSSGQRGQARWLSSPKPRHLNETAMKPSPGIPGKGFKTLALCADSGSCVAASSRPAPGEEGGSQCEIVQRANAA